VLAARGLGGLLTALRLVPKHPPPRHRRIRHWLASLGKVHDSLAIAQLGVPWWTYRSIDVVEEWIAKRPKPVRVFEFGSGASTIWLADRVDSVISVEHHRAFSEVINTELAKRPNVTHILIEPTVADDPLVGSAKAGHERMDFHEYVSTLDKTDGVFDLIVIDGRAREECLTRAISRLAPGGLIVFDNSHRRRYVKAIAASGLVERRFRGLTPTLPYPDQTSLLTVA
jgi:hypothetical protein